MVGFSIRHAQAAGLHLRNEDSTVSMNQKRAIASTWWALHSIECILTSITGRPRVIERKDCTVPLPSLLTEERPSDMESAHETFPTEAKPTQTTFPSVSGDIPETFKPPSTTSDLDAWTQLDLLQHKILSTLYAPRTAVRSWKYMQAEISSLSNQLDAWALQALPHGFVDTASTAQPGMRREQLLLYLHYQSAKFYITRPCLCRLDRRIKGQSQESVNFNQMTATACVQAALDLTLWLPEPTNTRWMYENGPWWSIVHISMSLTLKKGTR